MAKRAVDDLPDLTKPAQPAKPDPSKASAVAAMEEGHQGYRLVQVTLSIPLLPPGEADYISRQVNAKLLTMEQRRLFRSIVNGLGTMYPHPPGTSSKKAAAGALRYLLDQIQAQVKTMP